MTGASDGSRFQRRAAAAARDGATPLRGARADLRRARDGGRRDRLPGHTVEAVRRDRHQRRADPRGVRRLRAVAARRGDRVRRARPRARTDAALRERRRRCARAAGGGHDAQKKAWLPRIASGEAILAPAWLEPDGGFGPKGVQLEGEARRRRLRADRRQATRPVRERGHAARRAGAHRRRRARHRPLPRRSAGEGRHADAAAQPRGRHAVPRGPGGRTRRGGGSHRRRRLGLEDLGRRDARRDHPARRAGDGRLRARARDHGAVREGPQAVRQAARRVPGDLALPGRRDHGRRRRQDARLRGRVGRVERAQHRAARADGEALRLPDVSRRHRDVPAGVGRRRLHDRVRHPALLPARQAAAADVVGRPVSRGAGGGARCSTPTRPIRMASW